MMHDEEEEEEEVDGFDIHMAIIGAFILWLLVMFTSRAILWAL